MANLIPLLSTLGDRLNLVIPTLSVETEAEMKSLQNLQIAFAKIVGLPQPAKRSSRIKILSAGVRR